MKNRQIDYILNSTVLRHSLIITWPIVVQVVPRVSGRCRSCYQQHDGQPSFETALQACRIYSTRILISRQKLIPQSLECRFRRRVVHGKYRLIPACLLEALNKEFIIAGRLLTFLFVPQTHCPCVQWQNAGKSGLDQWNFTLLPTSSSQVIIPQTTCLNNVTWAFKPVSLFTCSPGTVLIISAASHLCCVASAQSEPPYCTQARAKQSSPFSWPACASWFLAVCCSG